MNMNWIILFRFISNISFLIEVVSVSRLLSIDSPTYWGTTECDFYPDFLLQDYQPKSGSLYMISYGLEDMKPDNDVTIVGLYYADTKSSQTQIIQQETLGKELIKEGFRVNNVAINNYAPYSCAQESTCDSTWWYVPWMPWISTDCLDYIAGCKSGDSRLELKNWQQPLIDVTTIPIFQDREWEDAWDRFGGGQNDIFLYDSKGRLYKYICSKETCHDKSLGSLSDKNGYAYIKAVAEETIHSNSTVRCKDYKPDDSWYDELDDIWSKSNSYNGKYDDDDDFYMWDSHWWHAGDDYDDKLVYYKSARSDHDKLTKRVKHRKNREKHHVLKWSTMAAVVAFSFIIVTFGILYNRYQKNWNHLRGNYVPIHSTDDENDEDDQGSETNSLNINQRRKATAVTRLSLPSYGASSSSVSSSTHLKQDSSLSSDISEPEDYATV